MAAARSLVDLNFDCSFTRELPGDSNTTNTRRQVLGASYSLVAPTPCAGEPKLVAASTSAAALLDLDESELATQACACTSALPALLAALRAEPPLPSPAVTSVMAGASPLPGGASWAACYGGHQFGNWASQLGDGRAISLAEVKNSRGERWEVQLKGAGATPYSRRGDGRAVLRSSVREFVASEAMHALGVPTTRALALVATGEGVVRDMFYSGDVREEPGAICCRLARSFIRFGSFQLPASRGDEALVATLLDYTIKHHYPGRSRAAMLGEVAERSAQLAARWQAIGFVHGVLNTDNCSILGETIDYGPFAWMEVYDATYTPNTTDLPGRRYCYRNQPAVMLWNVTQLANALLNGGALSQEEAQAAADRYAPAFEKAYASEFSAKLGLRQPGAAAPLLERLLEAMGADRLDFTLTFRALSRIPSAPAGEAGGSAEALLAPLRSLLPASMPPPRAAAWASWVADYRAALVAEGVPQAERAAGQDAVNPLYVPRNYLLQQAIEAAELGDTTVLDELLAALRTPFTEQAGREALAAAAPQWALEKPGVCVLSCSS